MRVRNLLAIAAFSLAACAPSASVIDTGSENSAEALTPRQELASTYIREHINEISPGRPLLTDSFEVTDIRWSDANTAIVTYQDGKAVLTGEVDVTFGKDGVRVKSFILVSDEE